MARAIPLLPVIPADPRREAPRLPIMSGQGFAAQDVGHWRDLARLINLDVATGNASVVFEQTWSDKQFNVPFSVGFVHRIRIAIPPLSGYHTLVRVSVFGYDPAATGVVRFRGTNAASLVDVVLPAVAMWTDSVTPHLPVAFAGAPSFEEITIETQGVVNVEIIKIEYLDVSPVGAWPVADDALPLGPIPGSANNANPLDDAEVAPDSPLSSDLGVNVLDNLRDLEARERVHMSVAGFNINRGAGIQSVIADYAHRVVASVLAPRLVPVVLTIAVYADGTGGAFELWVESRWRGFMTISLTVPANVHRLGIAAAGPSWRFYTLEMQQTRDIEAPDYYAGFTQIAIRPELMLATQNVQAVAMWSR